MDRLLQKLQAAQDDADVILDRLELGTEPIVVEARASVRKSIAAARSGHIAPETAFARILVAIDRRYERGTAPPRTVPLLAIGDPILSPLTDGRYCVQLGSFEPIVLPVALAALVELLAHQTLGATALEGSPVDSAGGNRSPARNDPHGRPDLVPFKQAHHLTQELERLHGATLGRHALVQRISRLRKHLPYPGLIQSQNLGGARHAWRLTVLRRATSSPLFEG